MQYTTASSQAIGLNVTTTVCGGLLDVLNAVLEVGSLDVVCIALLRLVHAVLVIGQHVRLRLGVR